MLDIHQPLDRGSKIYFTHSLLPAYLDPHNVSTKKQPFRTFNHQFFSHRLDLVLPADLWDTVRTALELHDVLSLPRFARVYMSLADILDAEFLDAYVRTGDIMMLSEGRPLVDNCFSLCRGKLSMQLDRQTYERCGLVGTPVEDGGRKHQKARWAIEYDLTLPCMKHGKKGFGRLEWAAKNVVNQSLTWLFYNFNILAGESLSEGREVLSRHAPKILMFERMVERRDNMLVPNLRTPALPNLYTEDDALALLEYLHLLHLGSPRLRANDTIDPYLSRYEVPDFGTGVVTRDFVQVSWKGFIPPVFAKELFLLVKSLGFKGKNKGAGVRDGVVGDNKAGDDGEDEMEIGDKEGEGEKWFAMSAQAFGGAEAWSVMQFEGRESLVWGVES